MPPLVAIGPSRLTCPTPEGRRVKKKDLWIFCTDEQKSPTLPTNYGREKGTYTGAEGGGGYRRGSRIQKGGGFVQEFRLENRSYPDVHDFSLRMQVIIAND